MKQGSSWVFVEELDFEGERIWKTFGKEERVDVFIDFEHVMDCNIVLYARYYRLSLKSWLLTKKLLRALQSLK